MDLLLLIQVQVIYLHLVVNQLRIVFLFVDSIVLLSYIVRQPNQPNQPNQRPQTVIDFCTSALIPELPTKKPSSTGNLSVCALLIDVDF